MSFAEVTKIVPPPAKPVEVGTLAQWRKIEEQLAVTLPDDYREFVFAFGTGVFGGLYCVYNPFAASKYIALLTQVCEINREAQKSFPERFPYPYYPAAGGLLPWGNDENGNDYFWLTEGPPINWIVVQDNNRGEGILVQPYSMTGFLAGILQCRIRPLASDYPRKCDLKFEPWDAGAHG